MSEHADRRTRLRQLAIVATIVVVAVAVLVVAAGGDSPRPPKPDSNKAVAVARQVDALLAGIPQRANTLGRPTAPVTLEWYGDLECPYCKEFTLGALPTIIRRWVRAGQLKIEYLSMETATLDPKAFQAQQVAALAAGMQNEMWNYIEIFYHEQGAEDSGYVTERYLRGLASQIPELTVTLWEKDRLDLDLAIQVGTEVKVAREAQYSGTPIFLLGRSGGTMQRFQPSSLTDPTSFNEAITRFQTPQG